MAENQRQKEKLKTEKNDTIHQSTNRLFSRTKGVSEDNCIHLPQLQRQSATNWLTERNGNELSLSSGRQKPEIQVSVAMFPLKVADESFLDSAWLPVVFWQSLAFCRLQMVLSNLLSSYSTLPVLLHTIFPACVSVSRSKFPFFIKTLSVIVH